MKAGSPRAIALQLMLSVLEQGRSLDDLLRSEAFLSHPLSPRDRAFVRELVYGQCRWYFVLQALLQSRLKKPLRDRDRDIECILLAGLYQLLLMRTEAHAAVNESVKLAVARNKRWASAHQYDQAKSMIEFSDFLTDHITQLFEKKKDKH